jgi:monooxygenase
MTPISDTQESSMYEHFDVLIVGAGISGISSAVHLQRDLPHKRYAVLEARDGVGGTWDLFRYPGIRSDSDMFTLGFDFKPWIDEKMIAEGHTIRAYVEEAARQYGVDEKIRFGHRVLSASWSSEDAQWTVEAELPATGDRIKLTADFIHVCGGYYRYDEPFMPVFPGAERFQGTIIHPQRWPDDLDYSGKRVVVIGSGATAVTLVPAMSDQAEHVTMLQRSPSYVVSLPAIDPIAQALRRVLPEKVAYGAIRVKQIGLQTISYRLLRRFPKQASAILRKQVARQLPGDASVEKNFKPRYDPWDERLCIVPDGDLFGALRSGKASVVTDTIETFTETGIKLTSGAELEADIIITATGLQLQFAGGAAVTVDGTPVDSADTVAYKGLMYSGIPNAAITFGYINASWTLKADLVSAYVCRLLKYMDEQGYDYVMPLAPPAGQPLHSFVDMQSGYFRRAAAILPKQGDRWPWRANQNYLLDYRLLKYGAVDDEGVRFGSASEPAASPEGELTAA